LERIFNIIHAEDFNLALTNLLIDLYSSNYEKYFEELIFNEEEIEKLNKEELEKLTKVAAIIEYIGNRQPKAKLYDWIYSDKLKLEEPYTPGLEKETFERVRRIISAPKEFASRNVFYDEKTLKPF
jgi:SET domain-containing protein